jgi:hypothetical protein
VDIERTIEFILQSQARAEIRTEKADIRMEKFEARMDKSDARVAAMEKRLDKRMDGITKLLQQGMRILVKTQTELAEVAKAQKRTDIKLEELAAAQRATDRSLKALIDSLRNGRNGRKGR